MHAKILAEMKRQIEALPSDKTVSTMTLALSVWAKHKPILIRADPFVEFGAIAGFKQIAREACRGTYGADRDADEAQGEFWTKNYQARYSVVDEFGEDVSKPFGILTPEELEWVGAQFHKSGGARIKHGDLLYAEAARRRAAEAA
jgi:hypothetical protein